MKILVIADRTPDWYEHAFLKYSPSLISLIILRAFNEEYSGFSIKKELLSAPNIII